MRPTPLVDGSQDPQTGRAHAGWAGQETCMGLRFLFDIITTLRCFPFTMRNHHANANREAAPEILSGTPQKCLGHQKQGQWETVTINRSLRKQDN